MAARFSSLLGANEKSDSLDAGGAGETLSRIPGRLGQHTTVLGIAGHLDGQPVVVFQEIEGVKAALGATYNHASPLPD